MHLSEYLEKENLSPGEFAVKIGVHRSSVVRFASGSRRPDLGTIQKIHEATHGKVKAEDFFKVAS